MFVCTRVKMTGLSLIIALTLLSIPILTANAQTGSIISGRVVESAGKTPLSGANIYLEGTSFGAASDVEGKFRIFNVPEGNYKIKASYLSYETQEREISVTAGKEQVEYFELNSSIIQGNEVLVTGFAQGQAKALNNQKMSDNIKNVVAADLIGRFPDPNAAEALQRLPGISIQRDQGEGRYVLIRGVEARLNSVTVNGERLPSPEGEIRSVALDVLPSDIISTIEVNKTLTPDMDADAIGGSINLVTKSARDYSGSVLKGTFAGGYNQLVSDYNYQSALTYGTKFGPDQKWGFLMTGSFYQTNRGSDNNEFDYDEADFDSGSEIVLDNLELRDYIITRKRLGVSGTLDYTFNDNSMIYFRGIYNKYDDDENRRRVRFRPGKGDFSGQFSAEDAVIERSLKDRFESQKIINYSAGGKHLLNSVGIDYRLAYSYAEEDEPGARDITFVQEELNMDWNLGNPDYPQFNVTNNNPLDPGSFIFDGFELGDNLTTDRDYTGSFNLTVPFGFSSGNGSFKFGGRYKNKNKDRIDNIQVFDWEGDDDYLLTEVAGTFENPDFLDNKQGEFGPAPDPSKVRQHFNNNRDLYEEDSDASREETDPANFDASENITAGYGQAKFNIGRAMVLAGVRVERTSIEYTGNTISFNEDGDYESTASVSDLNDYTNFFPMVHLRYSINENTNLRAAWTNSIARPDYYSLVPYQIIINEDEEIETGNPALKPTKAMNFDFLIEHYFRPLGIFSIGPYYKRLNDYIYQKWSRRLDGSYAGFQVFQPFNGESASLWGFEVNWQHRLSFLPGALSGLGIYANYTYTSSEAEFPDREGEKTTLPGQADHMVNFALSYERRGFSGRISLNVHGKYIDEVGESSGEDIYYDDHFQWDISASQRIHKNIRLFAEIINLSNAPLRYYRGISRRPVQQEFYKLWTHFGLKFDL